MSFILDALRRAETQRGDLSRSIAVEGSLDNIAKKSSSMPAPRWIAVLLVAAAAVTLIAIMGRQQTATTVNTQADYQAVTPGMTSAQTVPFAIAPDTPLAVVAAPATRIVRPLGKEAQARSGTQGTAAGFTPGTVSVSEQPLSASETPTGIVPGTVSVSQEPLSAYDTPVRTMTNLAANPGANESRLPSYAEAAMSSRNQLPEFHLDIHVYATEPIRRFVFVNNRKYREGEQLDEGGTVERITPSGVVLNHRGRRFVLFPD